MVENDGVELVRNAERPLAKACNIPELEGDRGGLYMSEGKEQSGKAEMGSLLSFEGRRSPRSSCVFDDSEVTLGRLAEVHSLFSTPQAPPHEYNAYNILQTSLV